MKLTYRPEIDGLRAIAVVAVILYHARITILGHQPFKGGFSGTIETQRYDLNKVLVQTLEPNKDGLGFIGKCSGNCRDDIGNKYDSHDEWWVINKVSWERNRKALSHLFGNFCTGFKSAF